MVDWSSALQVDWDAMLETILEEDGEEKAARFLDLLVNGTSDAQLL